MEDRIRALMHERHIPGLSLAVVKNGDVMAATGYGLADVERKVPANNNTVYEIGSVTKQFTASAIMLLVRDGRIKLDDKITQFLVDASAAWAEVTVWHLLTHTSGIKDFTEDAADWQLLKDAASEQAFITMASSTELEVHPGDRYGYSNFGYILLGRIVEKASGEAYGEFLSERIFRPLGMNATRTNDPDNLDPDQAQGYNWQNGTLVRLSPFDRKPWWIGSGGLVSSVADMANWDAALRTGRLLTETELQQMWTPARLNGGEVTDYGFGWIIRTFRGRRLVLHGGSNPGFAAYIGRFIDDKVGVILMANLGDMNSYRLAEEIIPLYLPE